MSQLPTDWLEKFFDAMKQFYQDRWTIQFKNDSELNLYKVIWHSALNDLDYEQIKEGLKKVRDLSRIKFSKPPHHIEFYHWCIKKEYNKVKKVFQVPRRTY